MIHDLHLIIIATNIPKKAPAIVNFNFNITTVRVYSIFIDVMRAHKRMYVCVISDPMAASMHLNEKLAIASCGQRHAYSTSE